jgi:DNA-binding beta-propeller fold protein YncE
MAMLALPSPAFAAKGVVGEIGSAIGSESHGSGDGELAFPRGVAVNQASGDVYVADTSNQRIEEFGPGGAFVRVWGAGGSAGAQFQLPSAGGIAIDQASGDVYVQDAGNNRVQQFDSSGNFIRAWGWDVVQSGGSGDTLGGTFEVCTVASQCQAGSAGSEDGQLGGSGEGSLAIDPASGEVYVADPANGRVQVFSSSGSFLSKFGTPGSGAGQFGPGQPTQVAIDSAGIAYASDSNAENQIQRFDTNSSTFLSPIGSPPLLGTPTTGLAIDPGNGDLLVAGKNPSGETVVQQFNTPGEATAPTAADETHAVGEELTRESGGIDIRSSTGLIYLPYGPGAVAILGNGEAPVVTIEPASDITGRSATLHATVNPKGATAHYHFEYSEDGITWLKAPASDALIAATSSDVAVSQAITNLAPGGTLYHVRIVVDAFGPAVTSGENTFNTAQEPPLARTSFVAPRGSTTARLNAEVDPQGLSTEVRFEYGTAGDCASNPCAETASLNVGSEYFPEGALVPLVAAELSGLQPGTTYHYRVLATNGAGTTVGADRTFATRTIAETTLAPRGDELVNPPDKGNQNVFALGTSKMEPEAPPMTPDGEKIFWHVEGGAPGGFNGAGATFLSERSPSGWQSRSLLPPAAQQFGRGSFGYKMITKTPDLSKLIFTAGRSSVFGGVPEMGFERLDLHQNQTQLQVYSPGFEALADVTDDGSHVLFVDPNEQLVDIGSGTPEVVSIMPDGNPSSCGIVRESGFIGRGFGANANWRPGYHRIDTTDASLVYFEAKPNGECSAGAKGLYVRDRGAGETTLIDPGIGVSDVELVNVTPDGKQAYFLTSSQLEPADTNSTGDIYRWDQDSRESSCLTCIVPEASVKSSTRVLVSTDFSHIYFGSENQLIPGKGRAGQTNLYVLSEGALRFIGTIPGAGGGTELGRGAALLTADGNVLTFLVQPEPGMTADSMAAECHNSHQAAGLGPCYELYRYEASTQSLECLSCVRNGTTTYAAGSPSASVGIGNFKMSPDGNTVAFATKERLLPADINGNTDIYEWHNDSLRLITDGVAQFPEGLAAPEVVGVSSGGRDIFFSVAEPGLTGFEQDGFSNLYDARIGGGFERPSSPTHCSEETCQTPPQAAPGGSSPSSAAFSGRGNLPGPTKARKCAKGKVRRRGRCVRRHVRKRHRSQQRRHRRAGHGNRGRAK